MSLRTALLAALAGAACAGQGNVAAVYALIERVLPGASPHFSLSLAASCGAGVSTANGCFVLSDGPAGTVAIAGTSAAELTGALGLYLREYANLTIGWPRGGGSFIEVPAVWPVVGLTVARARTARWSYVENVCTHSYSLVWYDWPAWQNYIDWAALSGINHMLGMTGQEEVAYRVLSSFGLTDFDIRDWFNGPAFLTWSRGQNEYGNGIAGPLPRSWMKGQWDLARLILARQRELGIVAQLPAFQGNVPWQLAAATGDANITQQGDTGWMNSVDPLFAKLADAWMLELCASFSCEDGLFQMDGYFDGGTAPWRTQGVGGPGSPGAAAAAAAQNRTAAAAPARRATAADPPCTFGPALTNMYLGACTSTPCASFGTVAAAEAACAGDYGCGGITSQAGGAAPWELRVGPAPAASPDGETSYVIDNAPACRPTPPPVTPDLEWVARGAAAYAGIARTVPGAIWSFQGWAIVGWSTYEQARSLYGFVSSAPAGKFLVVDMSVDGTGEWTQWANASFFGAPFIWTSLHDFGGTDGMKGDLARANVIPWGVAPAAAAQVWGTGFTPEGLDQNPAYYELLTGVAFRTGPVLDLGAHMVERAHRRYRLSAPSADVTAAWLLLVNSTYAQDLSVQDNTGVPHLPGSASQFLADRSTPSPRLCLTWAAWGHLLTASTAAASAGPLIEPLRYDLVNLGRELLAQLATPASLNYSDALHAPIVSAANVTSTGTLYVQLLADVDALVATDTAFLLGPWLQAARAWGDGGASDCAAGTVPMDCADFYEWNARSQLTTWNPTPYGASVIPDGPIDYASKHWSGLIDGYYGERARGLMALALAGAPAPLNQTAVNAFKARLAYDFQNAYPSTLPLTPVGDAVAVSAAMRAKYAPFYAACA